MENQGTKVYTVSEGGERVDGYLARESYFSRSRVQALIREGRVLVDGKAARKSDRLRTGQEVEVRVPPITHIDLLPEAIPIEIIYQDSFLAVVNKPAGVVVHPGPGHRDGTLVNAMLHHIED